MKGEQALGDAKGRTAAAAAADEQGQKLPAAQGTGALAEHLFPRPFLGRKLPHAHARFFWMVFQ
jgi:hypothetical protein